MFAIDLYRLFVEYRAETEVILAHVQVRLAELRFDTVFSITGEGVSSLGEFERIAAELSSRALEVGGKIDFALQKVPPAQSNVLAKKLRASGNEGARDELVEWHESKMFEAYVAQKRIEVALFHAEMILKLKSKPEASTCNNIGYVFLAAGEVEIASRLLAEAAESATEPLYPTLCRYNLAVAQVLIGDCCGASETLTDCLRFAEQLPPENSKVRCVFRLAWENGAFKTTEVNDPDLRGEVEHAVRVLDMASGGKGFARS